jgi:hypothetical protein
VNPDALTGIFKTVADWAPYLLAAAGLGTLTMALLQAVKEITPIRRVFQKAALHAWLIRHAQQAQVRHNYRVCPMDAKRELIQLVADDKEDAFFDLEIEKLCGQWSSALQILTDYADEYGKIYGCMAAYASQKDFKLVFERVVPPALPPHIEGALPENKQEERLHGRQTFLEAKNRVAHQMKRAIDAFQIETSYRWKWHFQIASYVINFGIVGIALLLGPAWSGPSILGAAVAGFIAPVARDLLAAVQKLRE